MLFGKHVNKFYKKYFFYFFFGILTLIAVDYIQLLIPELIGNVVDGVNTGTITFTHLYPQKACKDLSVKYYKERRRKSHIF